VGGGLFVGNFKAKPSVVNLRKMGEKLIVEMLKLKIFEEEICEKILMKICKKNILKNDKEQWRIYRKIFLKVEDN
jgi:hypothetical protein